MPTSTVHRPGPRILIIRLSALGDVLVTTPVTRALRQALPDAHLSWVVETRARELLAGNPYLDEVLTWDRRKGGLGVSSLLGLTSQLRQRRFDWAVDCQGNLRSALIARLSGARRVVGNSDAKEHADRFYHLRVPRDPEDRSSRQRCLDLLRPLGVQSQDRRMVLELSDAEAAAGGRALAEAGLPDGTPYAAFVPATTWAQKHWFEERWSELAVAVRRQLGLTPVLMGAPPDLQMVERIREAAGPNGGCVIAAGKTGLKSATAVLRGAQLTVAVDTALMHASVAVGTPTVALCGASWWPGFADYEGFALLREPMECSPCLHRPTCEGRFDCMRALTVNRVLAAARSLGVLAQ